MDFYTIICDTVKRDMKDYDGVERYTSSSTFCSWSRLGLFERRGTGNPYNGMNQKKIDFATCQNLATS